MAGGAVHRLDVEGSVNLGDLGGLPLPDGRSTRQGVLFRSGALCWYSPAGLQHLSEILKVSATVDMRSGSEVLLGFTRKEAGGIPGAELLAGGAQWKSVDVSREGMGKIVKASVTFGRLLRWVFLFFTCRRNQIWADIFDSLGMGLTGGGLVSFYGTFLETCGKGLGEALAEIAARVRDGRVTVFHCTHGKDRCGVATALILKLAGVSDEVIVENYALSAQQLAGHPEINAQMAEKARFIHPEILTKTPADAMRFVLERVRDEYGGVERYVAERCGLSPEDVETLRGALVPAPKSAL